MRAAVLLLLLLAAALVSASTRPEEGSVHLQAPDGPLSPLAVEDQALSPEERVKRSPQRPPWPLPGPGAHRPGGRPGR